MQNFVQNLKAPWTLTRTLRLSLALFLFYDAFKSGTYLFLIIGVWLAYQALWNVGCGGSGQCDVPSAQKPSGGDPKSKI